MYFSNNSTLFNKKLRSIFNSSDYFTFLENIFISKIADKMYPFLKEKQRFLLIILLITLKKCISNVFS